MSDYYCPTNFFNAKCRLKHIISQKFSGGLRPQLYIIVMSDYYCPQISLMPNAVLITLFLKNFPGGSLP